MFGGFGIFESGVMFARVNSLGQVSLRGDEQSADSLEKEGGQRLGNMPYWTFEAFENAATMLQLAQLAVERANALKTQKKATKKKAAKKKNGHK